MAFPQMYAQQPQGTLMPGQMIAVNKYNVQVEKYLSQGGFAHVYLVRTVEPVFGTTHHVLKRIAVANEAMLNDVKKEVDIMRILKGHPNIVYLIDAAWHRMSNGMFEVFILMEFCQGGGIIDMMNRRLRERLTEAEILQIFVDVCEGVAAMHNLRPPLLHRDLKVENILQASATSFKLCDFGSTMPVAQRPPSSVQELRALEADLNKHTTLQYRAPEMVDVYLRRPIDEKSDVWALGVLLYKLCYYTTPFEEHGVLAILNVQYKFPPYPVYSQQLNALIASMLREHNAHRPSVFDVLNTVHRMRGTKSRFAYNIPKPPMSPRPVLPSATSRDAPSPATKIPDSISSPPVNGIQAREKVLEAIAPMRRGRPSSPTRGRQSSNDAFNLLDSVEGGPWTSRPAKAHKSGLATVSIAKSPPPIKPTSAGLGDAWQVPGAKPERHQPADIANGFTDSFNARASSASSSPSPVPISVPAPRPVPSRTNSSLRPPGGDAFESLNLFPSPRQQVLTLGEAQKVASNRPSPSPQAGDQKYSVSPSPSLHSVSPAAVGNALPRRDTSPLLNTKTSDQGLSAEQRFPSLEELDAGNFAPAGHTGAISAPDTASLAPPQLPPRPLARQDPTQSFYPASVAGALRPSNETRGTLARNGGARSQQVTGTAMRDARRTQVPLMAPATFTSSDRPKEISHVRQSRIESGSREKLQSPSRPILTRKHRSSVSIKQSHRTGSEASSPNKVISGLPVSSCPTKDWLTGLSDGEPTKIDDAAVLRASPEKRASLLVSEGPPDIGRAASFRESAPSPVMRKPVPLDQSESIRSENAESTIKRGKEGEKSDKRTGHLTENWSPITPRSSSSSDDAEEGPEDAVGSIRASKGPARAPVAQKFGHMGRQGSVHDLVDLWGGGGSPKTSPAKHTKRSSVLAPQPGIVMHVESAKSPSPVPLSKQRSATKNAGSTGRSSPTKPGPSVSRKPSLVSRQMPSNHIRQPPSPSKSAQPSSTSSVSRSRPQSMMLLPVQKAASETPRTPSKVSLSPPINKGRSTHRRSSISDLVSRYEAMDEHGKGTKPSPSIPPAPAAKPARLRVVSPPSQAPMSDPAVSPTVASTRFPRISPTSSPKEPLKTGFSDTLGPPVRYSAEEFWKRDSGSRPSSRQSSRPPSPLRPNLPLPAAKEVSAPSASEPLRTEWRPHAPALNTLLSKDVVRPGAPVANKDADRSTSPEDKPYQGVSKLIDQWQRKSEESVETRGGGNTSLRGAGSRFRREGIAAGGKAA